MTVCIGALCLDEQGEYAAVCAMDTELSRSFTSSLRHAKYNLLPGRWLALLAFDDLSHAEGLLRRVNQHLLVDSKSGSFDAVMGSLGEARKELIAALASDVGLPPGLTLQQFYADGREKLPEWAYQKVWDSLTTFRLGCDLLIVGFDNGGIAHMLAVGENPPVPYDRVGFHAIGSGAVTAIGILSGYDHNEFAGWKDTAYEVYAAKKSSERAIGVGPDTLMFLVHKAGLTLIRESRLDPLFEEFGALPPAKHRKALSERLAQLDLNANEKGEKLPVAEWTTTGNPLTTN